TDLVAMNSLGYKQMAAYIQGEYELAEAICLMKRDTRHFAKRQLTLFKKIPGIIWYDVTQYASVGRLVEDIYNNVAGKICI
ncbi:MAG: tRNA dimethylallyltransferase, partial [Bacillota bacterium]